jgi:hypothetical protein
MQWVVRAQLHPFDWAHDGEFPGFVDVLDAAELTVNQGLRHILEVILRHLV